MSDSPRSFTVAHLWRSAHPIGRHAGGDQPAPGGHSSWCSVVISEGAYRPVRADEVVVVAMDDKLLCRVARTAFTLTIHYADVLRIACVPDGGLLEVQVPGLTPDAAHEAALPRTYVLQPFDVAVCAGMYRALLARLSRAARAASDADAAQGTPWWWCREGTASFFPPDALAMTGFYEVQLEGLAEPAMEPQVRTYEAAPAARETGPPARPLPASPVAPSDLEALTGRVSGGRPVKIHHAVAPPEWRTDLLPKRRQLEQEALAAAASSDAQVVAPHVCDAFNHCEVCHRRLARLERAMATFLTE